MQFIDKLLSPFKKTKDTEKKFVFSELSEEFLRRWATRLRFFRYVKARGGFDGDINEIVLALRYEGQDDLITLFEGLDIPYKHHLTRPPQSELGKSYPGAEFAKFPSLIPGTNWIEQPIWQSIDSVKVSVWCTSSRVEFRIVGPKDEHWRITETEFENAQRLEIFFEKYVERIIDPPIDTKNCICPKYYPQYWEAG